MSSSTPTIDPADVEPSGFMHASKRRAGGLAQITTARPTKPATARSRLATGKAKRGKTAARDCPTPERFDRGLIASPPRGAIEAPHRAISPAEQLRDRGALQKPTSRLTPDQIKVLHDKGKLDFDHRTSAGMHEAALRLRRHHEGSMIGTLKAQDLSRVIGLGSSDDTIEEAWVRHRDCFMEACRVMGWSAHPLRGAGRLVVAVVCDDMTVQEAARIHVGRGDTTALMGAAMDRLREGLYALASYWKMV